MTLSLGGYRPETGLVGGALTIALLGWHFLERAGAKFARPYHPAGWWMLPFLAYAVGNVLGVTPMKWLGWHDWLGWAQLTAVFWVVVNGPGTRGMRMAIFGTLVALAVTGVAMAAYQHFVRPDWLMLGLEQKPQYFGRSSGSFSIPNSFAGFLILLLPATLALAGRQGTSAVGRVAWGYVAGLLLLGLGLTLSRGAWLALVVALASWPFLGAGRVASHPWRTRVGRSLAVLGVAAVTMSAMYATMPQVRQRMEFFWRDAGERSRPVMWRAAWRIFSEYPLFGGGAGSYSALFEPYRSELEQKDPQWAHNDYLNTLSDYGAVGFGLFFGGCAMVAVKCVRRRAGEPRERGPDRVETGAGGRHWMDAPEFTTALGVGLLAFGFHLAIDFHLKVPALAMVAATVAGLVVSQVWPLAGERRTGIFQKVGSAVAGVVVIVAGVGWVLPHYRAEAIRQAARLSLDALAQGGHSISDRRRIALVAREEFSRAVEIAPSNSQAWADRAYAASILAHDEPAREKALGVEAEADARRALAQGAAQQEYWLRLGVALDMQDRWSEAGDAFDEALRRAPLRASTWFYYAYHLSLNRVALPRARAAIATCLRLDPSRPEAETLRQHLAADR